MTWTGAQWNTYSETGDDVLRRVRVTYEIPTVAQRRNIVGKCQGFHASPVGIKRTVNTHEAQSAPAETYDSHLSRSTARQIVFSPPKPHAAQQEQEKWGKGEMSQLEMGDAEWDEITWRLMSFILVHAAGALKGSKTIIKENQPLN